MVTRMGSGPLSIRFTVTGSAGQVSAVADERRQNRRSLYQAGDWSALERDIRRAALQD